ncbi:MAG: flavohemoglobin expression-modulating QEGLA motif protein [Bacteroidota bacterium]
MLETKEQLELQRRFPVLFDIDSNLNRLIKRIELLSYVNPLNIEKEKQRFFSSKYSVEPEFKYPKVKFNPYKLQRLFFAQRLEHIKDDTLRTIYKEVINYYSNMIQCIETIGEGRHFYYNSLSVYGTPTEKDVQNALFILHHPDEAPRSDMDKIHSPLEAKDYFEAFGRQYDFPLDIRFSTNIAADAMVSNTSRTLIIKKNVKFSKNQLLTLANHEIGVHLVTTYNGLLQPLKIFCNGLPKNVETQEGLAVFSEYMGGALTLKRLKELAYRVMASDSLIKGYSFADTFDLIHGKYKLNREEAFSITLRAHRGGGFTKDRLYLSGLRKVYQRYRREEPMDVLLSGKVSLDYEREMKYLRSKGLWEPIVHRTHSFAQKLNTNSTLDFILNNLK